MVSAAKKLDRVRDRAPFQPIAPDLDINKLVSDCSNFYAVERVDARTITDETMEPLRQLIQAHVIEGGKPLVLENWHQRSDWPNWIFNPGWLRGNHGDVVINVRDIPAQSDMLMTLKHYLNNLGVLASKFTPESFNGPQQRLYAKDIDCPPAWYQSLQRVLPACTFYLSPADLMSSLPPEARAQNLMCYFGHEGTYTPAHKEMCASLGQNIMVHTSDGASPGSSIWFMTASGDRELVAEYWLGGLGHDIEVESHFASVDAFMEAPFPVYIVEQKLGDYILVPPLAPHQVWNRGEATMKVAWNRTTPETLELAIWESLPKSRLVCRDEQYKNKAIIYETLKDYFQVLSAESDDESSPDEVSSREKMKADFCKLFKLFNVILLDEEFSFDLAEDMNIEKIPNEFNVVCSFCRGNIFNRFLSCKNCIPPSDEGEDDDVYDVCLECYARGRSCGCISNLCWVEQHDWQTLVRDHDAFRQLVISIDGAITDESPLEFDTAFEYLGRKSLAWVCQEQLQCRPFVDITKDPYLEDLDDDQEIKRKKELGLLPNCHVCKVRHAIWKVAQCSGCTKSYCYGSLWRAFDIDPFDALSDHTWKCPVCLGICSCGQCRKNGKTHPYEPKGTMLGASTKHVADPRSVQSLVDFSRGNLGWLQPEHVESLKRKRASISVDATDNGEGSLKSFHQSPLLGYRLPSGVHGGDEEPEIPIDPSLEDNIVPGRDHYIHADSPNSNPNTGDNGVGGNGQYTSNDSSVALVERGRVSWVNASRQQVDGSVSSPRTTVMESVVDLVKENWGKSRTKHSLFPSPDDMLTGALPSRRRESPSDTHPFHLPQPDSYLSGVRSLSGKPQSKISRGEVQPYRRRQSFAQDINSDDQSLSLWPEMSSLEKDPAAFIAAAGLSILSTGTGFQNPHQSSPGSTVNCQPGVSSTWPTASTIPPTAFAQDIVSFNDDFSQNRLRRVAVQPHILARDPSELDSRERAFFTFQEPPTTSHENYRHVQPPSQVTIASARGKHNSIAPSGDIYTSASSIIGIGSDIIMAEPTKPMREMIISDWVKKQKLVKTRVANLKGRGKNRKSLVVVLKLGREGWKKWQEQKVEPDIVTKELVLGGEKVHKVLVGRTGSGDVTNGGRSVSTTAASASAGGYASGGTTEPKTHRRGRPKKNPKPEFIDVDQDDEQGDEDDEEPEVIPRPKARSRESAWMARKREEEAKEEAANAIENEKRAKEKAIEDKEREQLKVIEDEKRRVQGEKQRREDEKKAIEEEKWRKEEERLQAIEDEKYRKETERRRAYQEAKRVAAKMAEGQLDGGWDYDSEEEYEQDYYQEEEMVGEKEVEEVEKKKAWWESKLPGSYFAVAIRRRPGYHWKTQYITETELALRAGELGEPSSPTPALTTKVPNPNTPTANSRNIVGKPPAVVVMGDISPVTKPRRKSTAGVAITKTTPAQKSIVGGDIDSDDEYTASKWSLRKMKVQGTKAPRTNRSEENIKDGLRRSAVTKYSDSDETFEYGKNADWSVNDGEEEMGVEAEVNVEGDSLETEEGYDDRWKRKGRKWMW